MQNAKGIFITFEGIDGSGKTTQLELVDKYLREKNYKTLKTLEPGGCNLGEKLREILLHYDSYVNDTAELLLYLADRAQHTDTVILKGLKEGKIVLCDRFIDSTVAYQGYGRGFEVEKIDYLNKIATLGLIPNLTLVFDIDIESAQKRVGKTKDRMEQEKIDFHKKVREGYLELAKKYPKRIKIIDSTKTIEEIHLEVVTIIDKVL